MSLLGTLSEMKGRNTRGQEGDMNGKQANLSVTKSPFST